MVEEIRTYLYDNNIIDEDLRLNVDFLGADATEFAISVIPVDPIIDKYITGMTYRQFQFQLISCNEYGADVMQNISNSKFYENLYEKIETLNKQKKLPNISGIDKIECLNNGAISIANTNTARYSIQMRILYYKEA